MTKTQKKRIGFFALNFVFTFILFLHPDTFIAVSAGVFQVILVGFVLFLRDEGMRFESDSEVHSVIEAPPTAAPTPDLDESFSIVNKTPSVPSENKAYDPDGESIQPEIPAIKPPDLKERYEEIVNEFVPLSIDKSGEFSLILEKILILVKETNQANSAVFFWYDKRKEKLSLDSFSSESNDIEKRKFDVEDDILSNIVLRGEPEIFDNINPASEGDLIRYYKNTQGIRSFVGVPVYYEKNILGVLALDSRVEDTFGVETVYILGRYVRIITMLIKIFETKHDAKEINERLKTLTNMIKPDSTIETDEDLTDVVKNTACSIVDYNVFTFVLFDPILKKFKVDFVDNKTTLKYVGKSLDVQINSTLVGKAFTENNAIKIDDMLKDKYVRFAKSEEITLDGTFLVIPISFNNKVYGALCYESLTKHQYSNKDIMFIKGVCNLFGFMIDAFNTKKMLTNFIAYDVNTHLLNEQNFKERVELDLERSIQFKVQSVLILVRIDDFLEQESLFDGNPLPQVLKSISELLISEVDKDCILGMVEERTYGLFFFNKSSSDANLWADKVKQKISRKPIIVSTKQENFTVCMGIAASSGETYEELFDKAQQALDSARSKGASTIRTYP